MWNTASRAPRRRSARAAFLLLWLSVSLTVSSCGGSDEEPGIPRATAEALAERSDLVAQSLARGDRCAAAQQADRLLDEAIAAVNAGRVPSRFQDELTATANELATAIDCPPPAPPPVAAEEEDGDEDRDNGNNGKSKGKGKGKGKGKKGKDD